MVVVSASISALSSTVCVRSDAFLITYYAIKDKRMTVSSRIELIGFVANFVSIFTAASTLIVAGFQS